MTPHMHREKPLVDGVVLVLYYPQSGSTDSERLKLLQATV